MGLQKSPTFALANEKEAHRLLKQPKHNAEIAQLVEHNLAKVGVASSSLVFRSLFGTYNAEIAQLVEHNLAKVGVASSSLVFRSRLLRKCDSRKAHVAEW